jgi:signal peptidase II
LTRQGSTVRTLAVAAVVIAVDQALKAIVRDALLRGERRDLALGVDIVNVRNSGVAFGFLSGGGALVAVGGALALLVLLAFFLRHAGRPLVWLPTGLLLGGAAGNLIDRIVEGSVTDFVKLPHFPAFNVADASITVGVLALVYVLEGPPRAAEERRRAARRSPAHWPAGSWPPR